MRLYFFRHGLANHDSWDRPDFERPLNDLGKEKTARAAAVLSRLDLKLGLILTSPLVRARQTAEILVENLDLPVGLEIDDRLAPGFDIQDLQGLLRQYAAFGNLMVVGHEPDFSEVIGDLIGGADVVVKKGSLARVDLFDVHPANGELVWLLPPKMLDL
jgi:phosphohistidine phosphatase